MKCKVRKKPKTSKKKTCPIVVRLDYEQQQQILDNLTQRIEWSTNRIVDENAPSPILIPEKKTDAFSFFVKILLCGVFVGFGSLGLYTLFTNWSTMCVGGFSNTMAIGFVCFAFFTCIVIGIDLLREKDRNYLIALFSALVSLVALIVAWET